MKNLLSGFVILFVLGLIGQGKANSDWMGFDEGMKAAAANGRLSVVDFYTDWCSWCKKMDKEVFSRPDVAARLKKELNTIRVNAESSDKITYKGKSIESRQLTGLMRIEGYPTLMVLDPAGNPVAKLPGYVDPQTFMMFLDYLKKGSYKKMTFEQYYNSGGK